MSLHQLLRWPEFYLGLVLISSISAILFGICYALTHDQTGRPFR